MDFIIELITRLFSKTPKFFTTLKVVLAIVTVITGIPAFLTESGIIFPASWQPIILKVVSVASMVGTVVAQLTMTQSDKDKYEVTDK
jgi:hypothetical protein